MKIDSKLLLCQTILYPCRRYVLSIHLLLGVIFVSRDVLLPGGFELVTSFATNVMCFGMGLQGRHLCQSIGVAAIRTGFTVYYRSIFDTERDFLHDEAIEGHDKILQRYLKPDLLIIDDMGMKQLPKRSGEYLFEITMRRNELRSTMMTIDHWKIGAN